MNIKHAIARQHPSKAHAVAPMDPGFRFATSPGNLHFADQADEGMRWLDDGWEV